MVVPVYTPTVWKQAPTFPHPDQFLVSQIFKFLASVVYRVIIEVLMSISLITNEVKHLFLCLLAICISFLKCFYMSLVYFSVGLSFPIDL